MVLLSLFCVWAVVIVGVFLPCFVFCVSVDRGVCALCFGLRTTGNIPVQLNDLEK